MRQRDKERVVYQPPSCLAEAQAVRQKLIEDIAGINAQLSNKNKRRKCEHCNGSGAYTNHRCPHCEGRGGFRWSDHEYHEWRQRALTALRAREAVLRRVNKWIADEESRAQAIENGVPADTHDIIRKAHTLFLALVEDGVELDPAEWQVVEELRAFLDPKQALATG